ncbi:MAG: hypothetical protein M0P12_01020 [Paludibacteraceae bacterium]|nr:hypothetical protein [Paludibacteraceae bacterium]MCK9615197.1 hypothetical protein [Candidatus Omnitrophota bacterium]
MDIKALQVVAEIERKLEEKSALEQLNKISPYIKDIPLAAQVASYINTFRQPIPEHHPVFAYIENFKKNLNKKNMEKQKGETEEVSDFENTGYGEDNGEKKTQNAEILDIVNDIDNTLKEMEEMNDRLWYFLEDKKNILQSDYEFRNKFMKIRSYLKSNKSILNRLGR